MTDLAVSEFDSDEESDLQHLLQIDSAIEELKNAEPSTSASVSHGAFPTAAASICSSTSIYGEYSKIETALSLNRMCDEKLRRLESILRARLVECRRRLSEVQVCPDADKPERSEKFTYVTFGKPYFKDNRGFPAPDNEDTILMNKSEMYNFASIASVPGWTVKDKCQLSMLILKMSKDLKKKRLNSEIAALERENRVMNSTNNNKEISALRRKVVSVNKETLKTLVLPIDQEYDWDYIANKLSNRHSAGEYRNLWKLFLHPSINKHIWSKSEHMSLQKIAYAKGLQDWDAIAKKLGTGRTNYQCFVYFRTNMNNTFNSRKWTKEEEEYLMRLIEYYREENYIPWGRVAASMGSRTKVQVYNKYSRLSELRKGKFLPEEDSVLLTCVNNFGPNFRKVTEYLQGRSVTQCRERYNVLVKRHYSTVWTIEDDRKLIQLMANQDASINFSLVSQYFPGKDRVHIRSRYITLNRWMRRNPNIDIKHAPRRAARRLCHGKSMGDLNKAIETLNDRLRTEVTIKKKSKITIDSPEDVIDDAIVAIIATKTTRQLESQRLKALQEEQDQDCVNVGEHKKCNISVLRKLLILLKAKLNRQKFANSPLRNTYQGLLDLDSEPNTFQVRSYSKKEAVKNLKIERKEDIWGNTLTAPLSYVLPPHYATITGCKQLMSYYMNSSDNLEETVNMNILVRRNSLVKEQIDLLLERFQSLFLWPMLLSNISPDNCKVDSAKFLEPLPPRSTNNKLYHKMEYNSIEKKESTESLGCIDLTESESIDPDDSPNIVIDENYFKTIP